MNEVQKKISCLKKTLTILERERGNEIWPVKVEKFPTPTYRGLQHLDYWTKRDKSWKYVMAGDGSDISSDDNKIGDIYFVPKLFVGRRNYDTGGFVMYKDGNYIYMKESDVAKIWMERNAGIPSRPPKVLEDNTYIRDLVKVKSWGGWEIVIFWLVSLGSIFTALVLSCI